MQRLCIIPARGGSKRIPRKNVRSFDGKPILVRAIETAHLSGCFDEVMVSTEDEQIARLARNHGAVVPFMRSQAAAGDHATTTEALLEVIDGYAAAERHFDQICCLYPTAVLTTPEHLRLGLVTLMEHRFDVVLPVVEFPYPIWRSLERSATGSVQLNWPEHRDARSQDVPPAYHDAGQWYWFQPDRLAQQASLIGSNTGSILLDRNSVQDIDTETDWQLAEMKYALGPHAGPLADAA